MDFAKGEILEIRSGESPPLFEEPANRGPSRACDQQAQNISAQAISRSFTSQISPLAKSNQRSLIRLSFRSSGRKRSYGIARMDTPPMKSLVFILIIGALCFLYWHEPKAKWRGIPAPRDPVQTEASLPPPFTHGKYQVTPLANYAVTAVVLSRDHYRFDPVADIAPMDLALGWGPMSVASVINDLAISQGGRFYEYRWTNEPPLEPRDIVTHSANTHCLPATAEVRRRLLAVKRHQLVTLEGYLVEVRMPGANPWRSSLTREDSGGGACEILWVTSVSARSL